jgi:hypothetical protein
MAQLLFTPEQLKDWERDGYLFVRGLLDVDEVQAVCEVLNKAWQRLLLVVAELFDTGYPR